ncbi:MAG: ribbon-helix-helix domain-containing protein [Nanoarchaeota archaeon]
MKERITVTVDKELLEWIDRKIAERIFANRSHGFEYLIAEEIRRESQNYSDS